jgi:ketosteroid isomerase-like protein
MSATDTVRKYYAALRAGDPLAPLFAEREDIVKVGITERLAGYEAVAAGLAEQTSETSDWTVESRDLRVTSHDGTAWFSDAVRMAWTEDGTRHEYDSRWSGALLREDGEWRFVGMHVSAPH